MYRTIRFPCLPVSLIVFALLVGGCGSDAGSKPEAEVKILNDSVYVWNRGTVDWNGGTVFLGRRSDEVQKTFGAVTPNGFAQLPLREFRKRSGSDSIPVDVTDPKIVWVVMEGYAPARFEMDETDR